MSLGIGQYQDQTVQTPDYQTAPLTVSLSHLNALSTTPSQKRHSGELVLQTACVTALALEPIGTSSAAGENSVKAAVIVAQGNVDQNSNWPSALSMTTNDSVHVTIYARDQNENVHFVSAATTFNLAATAYIGFSDGTSPITSVTIPANQQSATFWIKGTSSSALPATVTVSNVNYVTYTSSITVNP